MFFPPHSQFWPFFSLIFLMSHLCLLLLLLRNFRRNIWNAAGTKMRDIWESHLSLCSLGKATTEQQICPMGSSHFFLGTSVWSLHTGFCWGILFCKFWCPPVHRYSAVDAWPKGSPLPRESLSHWGWCTVQSEDELISGLSLACWDSPVRKHLLAHLTRTDQSF